MPPGPPLIERTIAKSKIKIAVCLRCTPYVGLQLLLCTISGPTTSISAEGAFGGQQWLNQQVLGLQDNASMDNWPEISDRSAAIAPTAPPGHGRTGIITE